MRMVRGNGRRGMTLLEITVAMVIFALVMGSLLMTMRTGTKAYDTGITHSEQTQAARFLTQQIADDLRNVFYKSANSYNVTRRQREALASAREQRDLRTRSQAGTAGNATDDQEMNLGPQIDLGFRGSGPEGGVGNISFVRREGEKRSADERQPWGLARIHYYVADDALWRAVDNVLAAEVDEDGNEIPKLEQPRIDKIANRVTGLDLKFGYFHEDEWKTTEEWDSEQSMYRNPPDEEEMEEDYAKSGRYGSTRRNRGGTQQGNQTEGQTNEAQRQQQADDLPAWVEVTISMADARNPDKVTTYRQLITLPMAQETYVPPAPDETKRQRGGRGSDRGGAGR